MYFDLESLSCTQQCDQESKFALNDTSLMKIPACRSLTYYVDSLSTKVVELGTIAFPYKDLSTVFRELVNIHSNSGRHITVNIKENTVNYLETNSNYVINLNKVTIQAYSTTSYKPGYAVIIGVDYSLDIHASGSNTRFNILNMDDLLINQKLLEYENMTGKDPSEAKQNSVFAILASNVAINGLDFTTNYSSISSDIKFFKLTNPHHTMFSMSNSHVDLEKSILYTVEHASFILRTSCLISVEQRLAYT